jgi:hypothetical protein
MELREDAAAKTAIEVGIDLRQVDGRALEQ